MREISDLNYELNLQALREFEEIYPMTLIERNRLRKWVYSGHTVDSNPWGYETEDGYQMDYVRGLHRYHEDIWGDWYRPIYTVIRND